MRYRVAVLVVSSISALFAVCGAAFAVDLTGTLGNDRLMGTDGDDELIGLSGKDKLVGLGGEDTLSGGEGRDAVLGSGEEFLFEGASDISGGSGGDFLGGTIGPDVLSGGSGNDYIHTGTALEDSGDIDTVTAGSGSDAVVVRNAPTPRRDIVRCGPGYDRVLVDELDVASGCESKYVSQDRFLDAVPDTYFEPLYGGRG